MESNLFFSTTLASVTNLITAPTGNKCLFALNSLWIPQTLDS